MQPVTQSSIDEYWGHYFGCDVASRVNPGAWVVPHAELAGYQGAFLFRRGSACLVSVPPGWLEPMTAAIAGRGGEEVFASDFMRGVFGSAVDRMVGPAWLGYADTTDFRPAPASTAHLLEPSEESALRRLSEECDVTEWEHSGLEFDRPPVCGCFHQDTLVAAAGYARWGDRLAHIGVVTHPLHRGQGHGKTVVSAITEHALGQGLVAQYRTLCSNAPSMAIGRALGFRQYALTLAVRLHGISP